MTNDLPSPALFELRAKIADAHALAISLAKATHLGRTEENQRQFEKAKEDADELVAFLSAATASWKAIARM